MSIARPNKTAGRIIIGPRQVAKGFARIVACEDGSGRIELYDLITRSWCDACGECTFNELWSAPAVSEPFSSEAWIKLGATNGAVAGTELGVVVAT